VAGTRRVHEIAKELNRTSKELLDVLAQIGIDVKGANSVVTPEDEARLRARLFGIKEQKAAEPPTAAPSALSPSLAGARLRKKAPRAPEAATAAAPEPAEAVTPAVAEAEKAKAGPPPAEAAKAAPAAEAPAAAKAVKPAEEKPAAEAAPKAQTPAEGEAAKKPGVQAKGAKVKKPGGAKPGRFDAKTNILEDVSTDRGTSISADAIRFLAKADRLARAKGPRVAGKKPAAPERAPGAKRAVPDAVRGKTGRPRPVGPSEPKPVVKKKTRLQGDLTLGELAMLLDVATEKIQAFFEETSHRDTTPLTVLTAEDQAAAATAMGFDASAEPRVPKLQPRMPVVTVLGHVDHGKTTLLDAIRKTNVVASESGGITQHIGASLVNSPHGKIVFIDTPGHEIFTHMRSRGAQVTDVVILVVAADDGVMPQTLESISHAKAAHVPIVVAITKMDKLGADALRAKKGLAEHGVTTEDWGGDVLAVEVSAVNDVGLDKLLEAVSLQAEMMELTGDVNARPTGVVIESTLDRGRGAVMTVLIQKGVLKVGDPYVVGSRSGRVRAMFDAAGKPIKEAGPSVPATVLGTEGIPAAGDVLVAMPNDRAARSLAALLTVEPEKAAEPGAIVSLDEWFKQLKEGEKGELGLVIKADVAGSLEALTEHVSRLGNDEVATKILHAGVGAVNEGDVLLAQASKAVVLAFRVGVEPKAKALAQRKGVDVRPYDVIYELLEDVRAALEGLLEPEIITEVVGSAEVRQVFETSGSARIAGSNVRSGRVTRGARARVVRDGAVVFEGTISSLRRFRDDVREVQQGYECGIQLAGFNEPEVGDVIEVLEERKVARRLTEKR